MLAPTSGETTITPQDKTKSNTTKDKHASVTKNTHNTKSTQKTKSRFSCLVRPPASKQSGLILVEREGMEN